MELVERQFCAFLRLIRFTALPRLEPTRSGSVIDIGSSRTLGVGKFGFTLSFSSVA